MRHYPASHGPAPLAGVSMSTAPRVNVRVLLLVASACLAAGFALGLTADAWAALPGSQHSALNSQLVRLP